MGRSRGGLTTKIHALVDANGNPIALKLTEGQAHDGRSASDMLDGLGTGQILLADRAYDSDALRTGLAQRGAWANAKPMPRRVDIPAFSPFLYRHRNLVERFADAGPVGREVLLDAQPLVERQQPHQGGPRQQARIRTAGCP